MCMNCGCGEPEKRHQPSDITKEDFERAAEGSGISIDQMATNMKSSIETMSQGPRPEATSA